MNVIVVHATAATRHVLPVDVAEGSTVEHAVRASGLLAIEPELQLESVRVGIWNRVVRLDAVLREGDRVEVYRPLIVDPKEARRIRAPLKPRRR
ncbi:MAG TPA: RnfH family protein [Burkholderiaceae bacterium]|nr:RnfH family protein [Burkholderiaceae bacterium]